MNFFMSLIGVIFIGFWIKFILLLHVNKVNLIYFQLLWINLYAIITDHCTQAIIERSILA
jgi:hypothetical protein